MGLYDQLYQTSIAFRRALGGPARRVGNSPERGRGGPEEVAARAPFRCPGCGDYASHDTRCDRCRLRVAPNGSSRRRGRPSEHRRRWRALQRERRRRGSSSPGPGRRCVVGVVERLLRPTEGGGAAEVVRLGHRDWQTDAGHFVLRSGAVEIWVAEQSRALEVIPRFGVLRPARLQVGDTIALLGTLRVDASQAYGRGEGLALVSSIEDPAALWLARRV